MTTFPKPMPKEVHDALNTVMNTFANEYELKRWLTFFASRPQYDDGDGQRLAEAWDIIESWRCEEETQFAVDTYEEAKRRQDHYRARHLHLQAGR